MCNICGFFECLDYAILSDDQPVPCDCGTIATLPAGTGLRYLGKNIKLEHVFRLNLPIKCEQCDLKLIEIMIPCDGQMAHRVTMEFQALKQKGE